jgi:hypothetical protein
MSERKDDTPEADEPSRTRREPQRRSYYYDDSTGYEIYDPDADTDDEEDDGNQSPAKLSPQRRTEDKQK